MTTIRGLALGLVTFCSCSQGKSSQGERAGEAPASLQQAIIGQADTSNSGGVALLRGNSPTFIVLESTCSASLIAPNVAMTARHCVESLTANTGCAATFTGTRTHSYLAIRTEADVAAPGAPFVVSQIRKPTTTSACDGDIALLILATNVPNELLVPVVPRLAAPPLVGETFSAIGYGLTTAAGGSIDGKRRRADGSQVACIGAASCGASPFQWFGAPPRICPGDSGGPALDAKGEVIGVASRGQCGASGTVAIYARTDANAALIVNAVLEGASLGGYPAPAWAVIPDAPDAGVPDAGAADGGARDGGATELPDAAVTEGGDAASALPTSASDPRSTTDGCSLAHGRSRDAPPVLVVVVVLSGALLRRRRRGVAGA